MVNPGYLRFTVFRGSEFGLWALSPDFGPQSLSGRKGAYCCTFPAAGLQAGDSVTKSLYNRGEALPESRLLGSDTADTDVAVTEFGWCESFAPVPQNQVWYRGCLDCEWGLCTTSEESSNQRSIASKCEVEMSALSNRNRELLQLKDHYQMK